METIDQIKIDEGGYKAEVYLCSAGKLTWLYGRNIDDRPITPVEWNWLAVGLKLGKSQKDWANVLFKEEINYLMSVLEPQLYPHFQCLPEEVMNILLNMGYNMGGVRFGAHMWPKFWSAIIARDWKQAAIEGRDSKWFNQVGQRSVRLMNSLENVI